MKVNREPRVFADEAALGLSVAQEIVRGLEVALAENRDYLLGAPSGRTPRSTYAALASVLAQRPDLDLSRLIVVMMDDYLVPDPVSNSPVRVAADLPYSCEAFGRREIIGAINARRSDGGIPEQNLWFPDPSEPTAYDATLESAGGIDFFILATGSTDGHVAFNPPGSSIDSQTRIVDLPAQTRTDNMLTFPSFQRLEEVPLQGITVGIATILMCRRAIMLVLGAEKRMAASRLLAVDRFTSEWPSTVVHECVDHDIYATADVFARD